MTSIDVGTYGAKVQSWRRSNPRDLLKTLIEENPGASRDKFLRETRNRLKDPKHEEFLDTVIEYWFTNNYNSLVDEERQPRLRAAAKVRKAAKVRELNQKVAERIRQEALFLLDTTLPNGKTVRDSTFGECAKIGGALSKIASKGKPGQLVGAVLSDAQLRKLQGRS